MCVRWAEYTPLVQMPSLNTSRRAFAHIQHSAMRCTGSTALWRSETSQLEFSCPYSLSVTSIGLDQSVPHHCWSKQPCNLAVATTTQYSLRCIHICCFERHHFCSLTTMSLQISVVGSHTPSFSPLHATPQHHPDLIMCRKQPGVGKFSHARLRAAFWCTRVAWLVSTRGAAFGVYGPAMGRVVTPPPSSSLCVN